MKIGIKGFFLSMLLITVLGFLTKSVDVNAAETAEEIIEKALDELKKSETVSFSNVANMDYSNGTDGNNHYQSYQSVGISSNKVDYAIVFEKSDYGMNEFVVYAADKKNYYKYGGETEYIVYEDYNYDEEKSTRKKVFEYTLSNLKKTKISKSSKKYYIITAKPNWKNSGYSKISMMISKKTGRLVKIKYTLAKGKTKYYRDTENMFIVNGGSEIFSNINYGEEPIKLPEELSNIGSENKTIDYEKVFPSWNPDSKSLKELVDFVAETTDITSPNYLKPEDRIAVFDMDGTILCEKAPVYFDYCLTMYRVLDDPTYEATEEEIKAAQEIRDHAYSEGVTFKPEGFTKDDLIASAFAGMTPEEFRSYVAEFADKTDVVGFEGMTYGQSFYKPMIEVINYLRDNGYDIWMVSACEREVVRALVEKYDIPYDHVVATDVQYVASGNGDEPADKYNMGKDEQILLGAPLDEVECGKSGKAAAIAREIGKYPVLAFGNSSGDYSMLNYAEGNPKHIGMGFLIVCDDTEREYGSDEKAADFYKEIAKQGWTAFSMANDWKTIYGYDVKKTKLPGIKEIFQDAA
ncbi:MAG: haloacid dehalogenase-like hydrolase [Lachnospiraceae bacterium]|nr:haloacid dehalogenase-like hydrolase [Lachnospiraceae bacterium]